MCIIRIHRSRPAEEKEEAPVIVPIRPRPQSQQLTTPSSSRTSSRLQHPQPARVSSPSANSAFVSGSGPRIVVAKQRPSPRATARPTIQHGSSGYSYGSGPVATTAAAAAEISEQRLLSSDGERRRRSSHASQAGFLTTTMTTTVAGRRSSGSVRHHPSSPRQSGASFRSTREKIVIVDANGRRRESGFH